MKYVQTSNWQNLKTHPISKNASSQYSTALSTQNTNKEILLRIQVDSSS